VRILLSSLDICLGYDATVGFSNRCHKDTLSLELRQGGPRQRPAAAP
jgi:hypothetical protein